MNLEVIWRPRQPQVLAQGCTFIITPDQSAFSLLTVPPKHRKPTDPLILDELDWLSCVALRQYWLI